MLAKANEAISSNNERTLAAGNSRYEVVIARLSDDKRERKALTRHARHFGDPRWIMLLELYAADHRRQSLCITELVSLSGAKATTGLRHIDLLLHQGLAVRSPDSLDGRRAIVGLTAEGRDVVERYCDAVLSDAGTKRVSDRK